MSALARLAVLVPFTLALAACTSNPDGEGGETGDDDGGACVEIDYSGCAQLYPPTYDQVWSQTLETGCGGVSSACHPSGGPAGSLTFTDPDTTFSELLGGDHVVPGDPACSPIMIRLESDDPGFRMPPGNTAIAEGARCSIATWIADGAQP